MQSGLLNNKLVRYLINAKRMRYLYSTDDEWLLVEGNAQLVHDDVLSGPDQQVIIVNIHSFDVH